MPAPRAIRLPDSIEFEAGACLGIPALTAHRAVFGDGPVRGQTILVTGGAGAVGSAAVQLARWAGAAVLATISSEDKARTATARGAAHTINYRTQDVVAEVKRLTDGAGVDRIVDVDFGGNLPTSLQILKPDAVIASYASRGEARAEIAVPRADAAATSPCTRSWCTPCPRRPRPPAIADITRALEEGALRPLIGQRLPFERIAEAHTAVERGSIIGNVVLHHA